MKRIVLTGGGSAGHVSPNLAILPYLLKEGYDVHYIGTEKGIERDMMDVEGVTYHVVKSGKLRRYFDWKNFTDPFRVIAGAFQSSRLMKKLKPDVCFSKGGFVSVPVVIGARLHKVPTLCHESDLTPGLANKICTKFANKIATTFPECAETLGKKAFFAGTPLRDSLFDGSREKGLSMCGFDGSKPVLMMMGGSLGAQSVNKTLREILPELTKDMDVIHITGKGNLDESLNGTPGYIQFEFVSDGLADLMAAADLILSRAGSNALCEFAALCKPMLLVPYPMGASRGDQILNAQSFEKRGLCHVLLQENMNAETLLKELRRVWECRDELTENLKNNPGANGTQKILSVIRELQK